jgi:hypothetical protein
MYLSTNIDEEGEPIEQPIDEEYALSWRQMGRWIKFKQTVEGDGTRFSKPHITLLSVHGLMQVEAFKVDLKWMIPKTFRQKPSSEKEL